MVNETSDRRRLTPKGARTRARIVEEAAALIHERGVAGTTLEDVKVAAEVSGSQMYHYFPDKNELVQAVIDYQADTIVTHQGRVLSSANGIEAWRNMVITAAKLTKAKGGCPLGSLGGQLAESDPEARALIAAGFDQWAAVIGDALRSLHAEGNSRPTSTRTTSPLPCSPRSKEDSCSPRCIRAPARSKLRSIPSSPSPSADEPSRVRPEPPPRSAHGSWMTHVHPEVLHVSWRLCRELGEIRQSVGKRTRAPAWVRAIGFVPPIVHVWVWRLLLCG